MRARDAPVILPQVKKVRYGKAKVEVNVDQFVQIWRELTVASGEKFYGSGR
jgi:hypothetical protein